MNGTHYPIDGELYVRVTTVCGLLRKPHLEHWRGKVGNVEAERISAASRALGQRIHAALEQVCLGVVDVGDSLPECDLTPYVCAFEDWFRANVREVVAVERLLVSRRYQYAGTTDLVARLTDGSLAVIDHKSSKAWPREAPRPDALWAVQLAAYGNALYEQEGLQATRRLVVHLPSNAPGSIYIHEFGPERAMADWLAFRSLLWVYQWQNGRADGIIGG